MIHGLGARHCAKPAFADVQFTAKERKKQKTKRKKQRVGWGSNPRPFGSASTSITLWLRLSSSIPLCVQTGMRFFCDFSRFSCLWVANRREKKARPELIRRLFKHCCTTVAEYCLTHVWCVSVRTSRRGKATLVDPTSVYTLFSTQLFLERVVSTTYTHTLTGGVFVSH